jgi:hypothetical protein
VSKPTHFETIMTNYKNNYKIIGLLFNPILIKEQAPDYKKLVNAFPSKDEEKIVSYLENGVKLFLTPLEVRDWLSSDEIFVGGASIRTDGKWFWRDYLAYFVKTYHFDLPTEFIEHARNNNWEVPVITIEQERLLVSEYYDLQSSLNSKIE